MSETSSIHCKQNEIENTNQICSLSHVKIEKFVAGNSRPSSHFRCLACWVVAFDYTLRLIQVGNNRNDHFRYFLGVRVRLIKVLFKANKGSKFWDFGYCPLNRECPLNTVSA